MLLTNVASKACHHAFKKGGTATLFNGDSLELLPALPDASVDLTITSPPYCMGKEYESSNSSIEDFVLAHEKILPEVFRATKEGGSICWQVGYHVKNGAVTPLDFLVMDVVRRLVPDLTLRNRVVWTFGHGLHCSNRFSGRHETILWFTKGKKYHFDLDAVRVPQKYPGKKSNRGPKRGEFSGNPLGKNPSDIWDIPNVKANHVEKTEHPCQFPVALAQRLVKALCPQDGMVLDPFSGVASTGVAAVLEGRRFIGGELFEKYVKVGNARLLEAESGVARIRPSDRDIYVPSSNESVAQRPAHFAQQN